MNLLLKLQQFTEVVSGGIDVHLPILVRHAHSILQTEDLKYQKLH